MVTRIGGPTPDLKYGTELTVEGPDGVSSALPVRQGDIFKLGGVGADGTGYKVIPAVAGDDAGNCILVQAKHDLTDLKVPLGVKVICMNGCQVLRLPYKTGSAPTIGQSVEVATASVREIVGKAFAVGHGYVLAVDTAAEDAEVFV
jgi:hypothetical protein